MEFPMYVGFCSSSNPHSCLCREQDVENEEVTYFRPAETGGWKLNARFIDGRLIVVSCLGEHLIGQELFPVSREQFLEDNRGVDTSRYK